jgi:hypothetical protein
MGKRKKHRRKAFLVNILAVCSILIMTSATSTANYNFNGYPVETRTSGIVNGGVFIGYEPWASTTTLTGSFDVPPGTVKHAYLYTGIWGGTEDYEGWVNVSFNGVYNENGLGPLRLQGKNDTNPNVWCSSHGKYWMYYNVTNLTNPGTTNTAITSKINGTIDGRVYGIVLVTVYEVEGSSNKVQYWLNDGCDCLNYVTPHNESTTYFNGSVDTANVSRARLTAVHLTGYEPPCSNCLKFNLHELDTSMIDTNDFELNTWDVTNYIAPSGNNASYSRGNDEYVNICNTILTLEYICGDVNSDGKINMDDVLTLWYDYADYPYPGAYTISNEWAADVNCDGIVNMDDVMTLWYDYADYPYPGAYVVNCCNKL